MIKWLSCRYRAVVHAYFAIPRRLRSIDLQLKAQRLVKDGVFTFPYGELEMKFCLPDVGMDDIQSSVVDTGAFWEVGLLEQVRRHVRPGAVVLDCGANIGNHALYFSRVCGAGKVHAFEPQKRCVEIMSKNLALNGVQDQVEIHPVVLGAKAGSASVAHREAGNVGGTAFAPCETGGYEMRTLDSYAFDKVDFIKIDVEGAHYDLLQGARETLRRCSPVVWIEMFAEPHGDGAYDRGRELELPMKFLAENGYRLEERLSRVDYLFARR